MEQTKDQKIANDIRGLLGNIKIPMNAGTELQLGVDTNQWLSGIVSGEFVVMPKKVKKAKPDKNGRSA